MLTCVTSVIKYFNIKDVEFLICFLDATEMQRQAPPVQSGLGSKQAQGAQPPQAASATTSTRFPGLNRMPDDIDESKHKFLACINSLLVMYSTVCIQSYSRLYVFMSKSSLDLQNLVSQREKMAMISQHNSTKSQWKMMKMQTQMLMLSRR